MSDFSIHQCATLACLLDVTTPKPGNVHRGADFEDMTFLDFALSAVAIGPAMGGANETSVGEIVLAAIRATQSVTRTNTNLGIVLLLAPLAKTFAAKRQPLTRENIGVTLNALTPIDAANVYQAIRLASPGGMGQVDEADVKQSADVPACLLAAMQLAADRDTIARQYVTDFEFVLDAVVPRLDRQCERWGVVTGILDTYLWILANEVDTLIARKCGAETAALATKRAADVLEAGAPDSEEYRKSLSGLDFWLRSDGHRRNPGTSADLVTSAIFVCLLERRKSFAQSAYLR